MRIFKGVVRNDDSAFSKIELFNNCGMKKYAIQKKRAKLSAHMITLEASQDSCQKIKNNYYSQDSSQKIKNNYYNEITDTEIVS